MRSFVVDASVAAGWFIPDEANPISSSALFQLEQNGAVIPDLFWHEIRNVLTIAFRRKRLSSLDVTNSMTKLRKLDLLTVTEQADEGIMGLVNTHQLSAYDAAYLALAVEQKLPLATLDKQLIAAAAREGVPLLS